MSRVQYLDCKSVVADLFKQAPPTSIYPRSTGLGPQLEIPVGFTQLPTCLCIAI